MKKTLTTTALLLAMTTIGFSHDVTTNTTTKAAISVKQLVKTTKSWNGTTLPAYQTGQPEVTILQISIEPNTKLPIHEHPVINAGILTKGELTVHTLSGKTLHMKAGDTIVECVDTWHYGANEGTNVAEIIVFYAGITNEAVTIKQKQK
jgi:quercetin dioxygenase-like cupin family protein